jgi:hypothetical protein
VLQARAVEWQVLERRTLFPLALLLQALVLQAVEQKWLKHLAREAGALVRLALLPQPVEK